tara:strand:+ start:42 stop:221 length:180 start_codon:yes stop_codon:yes gene_type:complete
VEDEVLLIVNKFLAAFLVPLEIGLPEEEELFVTFFGVVFGIFLNLSFVRLFLILYFLKY